MSRMRNMCIAAILLILLMSGCSSTIVVVDFSTTDYMPEPSCTADFLFEASVADNLPKFIFEIYENTTDAEYSVDYGYSIHISCPELTDYIPQNIEISSAVKWQEEYQEVFIKLIDIDFDGYADIQAPISAGTANILYEYYRWNVFKGQGYGEFEEQPFFELMSTDYKLFPDTKQIISTSHDSAVSHPHEVYQLTNTKNGGWLGEYKLIRKEIQELKICESGKYVLILRVFFNFEGNEKIYEETIETDEYNDSTIISENYLRFGAEHSFDLEEATQLLYQEYGNIDIDTGFRYLFTFEEMCLYEKLSCYKFRIQWLVDENHWSTIGYVGVTPDSRIFQAN